jgi:hypothetical protein
MGTLVFHIQSVVLIGLFLYSNHEFQPLSLIHRLGIKFFAAVCHFVLRKGKLHAATCDLLNEPFEEGLILLLILQVQRVLKDLHMHELVDEAVANEKLQIDKIDLWRLSDYLPPFFHKVEVGDSNLKLCQLSPQVARLYVWVFEPLVWILDFWGAIDSSYVVSLNEVRKVCHQEASKLRSL